MHLADPQFPPLLKGHAVKAPVVPLAHACRLAQSGALGAGDVVWSRSTARAALAIVLEPEVELEQAQQMGPLLMVALGDCLGALCPPKVAVHYRWPGDILLNGTPAGAVRLAAPRTEPGAVPAWLVIGAELDIGAPQEERQDWSRTSLAEEAGQEITRTDVLQLLSAYVLSWLDTWQENGFRPVHDQWLFRAEGREKPMSPTPGMPEGLVVGLDENANLLLRTPDGRVHGVPYRASVELIGPGHA